MTVQNARLRRATPLLKKSKTGRENKRGGSTGLREGCESFKYGCVKKKGNDHKPSCWYRTKCRYLNYTCVLFIEWNLLDCLATKLSGAEAGASRWRSAVECFIQLHPAFMMCCLYVFVINSLMMHEKF